MTLSRMPMILAAALMAAVPQAGPAKGKTAEQALETYREVFRPTPILDCPADPDPETITVCGKRNEISPYRAPLPIAREPGSFIAGEPRGMGPDCLRLCPQPLRIDLMKAVPAVVNGIKKIFDPDR